MHREGALVSDIARRARETLGRQRWLDRPSYRVEHALTFAFAVFGRHRDKVSNALHGTWLGHPLHPVLTSLPMGAAATAVILDASSVLPRARGLRNASQSVIGLAVIGNVAAAASGVTDWQHTHEESRRIGFVHGIVNGIATVLYAVSWRERRHRRFARGMACSAVGYGLTLGSGYLGGAMVYELSTGVHRKSARSRVDEWTPALPVAALDGRPRRVDVAGVGVVLYRDDNHVLAVGEWCPHLGAPMSDGWTDRGRVVCPWHGSRFAYESGEVVRGPATSALPCYSTRVRDGIVEVRSAGAP